jgi:hypothetical protein
LNTLSEGVVEDFQVDMLQAKVKVETGSSATVNNPITAAHVLCQPEVIDLSADTPVKVSACY